MDIAQGCGEDAAEDLDLDSTFILNVCPILSINYGTIIPII